MFIQQSLKRLLFIQFYVEMQSSYDFLGWDCCLVVLGLRALWDSILGSIEPSSREREKEKRNDRREKRCSTNPTATYCKRSRPLSCYCRYCRLLSTIARPQPHPLIIEWYMTLWPKNEELNDWGIEKKMTDVFRCSTEISVAEMDDSEDCENNLRADATLTRFWISVSIFAQ